jgi:hypothetical protein
MWQPLTGCNGDNRCNLRSGGYMCVDGNHKAAKIGELNGKTKKRHFFNENKVILGFH